MFLFLALRTRAIYIYFEVMQVYRLWISNYVRAFHGNNNILLYLKKQSNPEAYIFDRLVN